MHFFPEDTTYTLPERFTNPFRYAPHPLVLKAAELLMEEIKPLKELFSEGKMLGVLVVRDKNGQTGYLAGFSGNAGGRNIIEGFVPPIYNLLDPEGHFKIKEAEITSLNSRIDQLNGSYRLNKLKEDLTSCMKQKDHAIDVIKTKMTVSKKKRDEIRSKESDPSRLACLIQESQHEKAELKRTRLEWDEKIEILKKGIIETEEEIKRLKSSRASLSDELQKWIFNRYIVHNASGEEKSIKCIFDDEGLTPPGGTGECAAPKLLNHAYIKGMTPIAMGEFWYGRSPDTAVRSHGRFYPSCTSKCGPLLGFMTQGLDIETDDRKAKLGEPSIIHEDDSLIVVSKPSGMPSVPGLNGLESLHEWLKARSSTEIHPVHRLDMDTSGIMLYAKDESTAVHIRKQFESHTIRKTYKARLCRPDNDIYMPERSTGEINLPLMADYDERPRQKADKTQGKHAHTFFEVTRNNEDGTTDICFHPLTGRTHQLRVHSAHHLGLGRPILGDLLYGGACATTTRLHLHSASITFIHPASGVEMTFSTDINIY